MIGAIIIAVVLGVIAISLVHDSLIRDIDKKANKIFATAQNKTENSERDKFFENAFISIPWTNYPWTREQSKQYEIFKDLIWKEYLEKQSYGFYTEGACRPFKCKEGIHKGKMIYDQLEAPKHNHEKDVSAQLFVECNELIDQKLRKLHDDLLMGAGNYETESYHLRISTIERNLFMVSYKGEGIAKLWIKSDNEGVKINMVRI